MKIASVVFSQRSGGIGPVCSYAAAGIAKCRDWRVTLVSLRDAGSGVNKSEGNFSSVGLGLERSNMGEFLNWLNENPQDVIISSGVSELEPYFPYFPEETAHIVQVHDTARRYRDAATRYAAYIDGVVLVAGHIQNLIEPELRARGFTGLVRAVHNGASFPEFVVRRPRQPKQPVNMLYMGSMDPLKGANDLLPLLRRLKKKGIPADLKIVGGLSDSLRKAFNRYGFQETVTWTGRVPHEQCYEIASQSDVLINPTRKESFGMVTIEAMSMGCIPIAYDIVSGNREIVEDGKSGYLVPLGSIRSMVARLEDIYLNAEKWENMSLTAASRARECFNDSLMAQNLAIFIEKVLEQRKAHKSSRLGVQARHALVKAEVSGGKYRRIPHWLRNFARRSIGKSPHLSHWLAQRS